MQATAASKGARLPSYSWLIGYLVTSACTDLPIDKCYSCISECPHDYECHDGFCVPHDELDACEHAEGGAGGEPSTDAALDSSAASNTGSPGGVTGGTGSEPNVSPGSNSAGGNDNATGSAGAPDAVSGGFGGNSEAGAAGSAGAQPNDGDSSSTASGGTSDMDGVNTTSGEPAPTLCESYCDDIMESCTGPQLQYRDHVQCMRICEMLPEGELGQVNENTVSCRAEYVASARYSSGMERVAYCARGGPGGAGYCGSNCEGYCSLMMHVCSDVGVHQFDSADACVDACEALPISGEGYSVSNPLIMDGNHVECRLFHVTSAAMLDPEEHCEHAMGITLCAAPRAE